MINNYSDYLKIQEATYTGGNPNAKPIYWKHQYDDIKNIEWIQFSSSRYNSDVTQLKFRAGDEKYDYYCILVDRNNGSIYLEQSKNVNFTDEIMKKFRVDLDKYLTENTEAHKEMKLVPRFIKDIVDLHSSTDKYNL